MEVDPATDVKVVAKFNLCCLYLGHLLVDEALDLSIDGETGRTTNDEAWESSVVAFRCSIFRHLE
jgi:hypothetical protein